MIESIFHNKKCQHRKNNCKIQRQGRRFEQVEIATCFPRDLCRCGPRIGRAESWALWRQVISVYNRSWPLFKVNFDIPFVLYNDKHLENLSNVNKLSSERHARFFKAAFHVADLSRAESHHWEPPLSPQAQFDVVSCQFALHYCFEVPYWVATFFSFICFKF